MKSLCKYIFMGALILGLASCGKDNSTQGSKSSNTSNTGISTTGGSNFKNHAEMKNAFESMSLQSGLNNNDVIYHVGPEFGMQTQGGNVNFDFNYCIDLIFWQSGDCEQTSSGSQLEYILSNGEYKVVKNTSSNQVSYDLADGIVNNMFSFLPSEFNRNDDLYQRMLGINQGNIVKIVLSKADVRLSNNQTIKADYVEYFYDNNSVEGFVVSNALPLMANPLFITENYSITGALSFSGNKTIKSISVMTHYLEYNYQTNAYISRDYGQSQIAF